MNTFTKLSIKYATLAVFVLLQFLAFAQDEESSEASDPLPFSVSGSLDAYFRGNLNGSNDPQGADLDNDGIADVNNTLAPGTSFADLPGFSLGMVNLIGSYEGEKVGFVADLVFGPRGEDAVFGSVGSANIVNQLYAYWNATEALTFTIGNFNTFLGYEVISPTGNFNYSTSYMFSYGPFSHTGLKADLSLGSGFSVMGAIMNPTDATEFNPTDEYVGGFQLGYENDAGGAWLNSLVSDGFFQIDLTTGWDVTEDWYLGFNGTIADDNFNGVAGYIQYAASDELSLGTRVEYFEDKGVGVLTEDESVVDLTLSANYTIGGLTIIPEFRVDIFSEDDVVITDISNPANIETANSLSSFVLAAVYAF